MQQEDAANATFYVAIDVGGAIWVVKADVTGVGYIFLITVAFPILATITSVSKNRYFVEQDHIMAA